MQRIARARLAWPVVRRAKPLEVQVLSDPDKRKIYDVYGREGLRAGLELTVSEKSIEELRTQWLDFQQKSREIKLATEVAPNTQVVINATASELVSSVNTEEGTCFVPILGMFYEPIWPIITAGVIAHSCNFKLGSQASFAMGGASQRPVLQHLMLPHLDCSAPAPTDSFCSSPARFTRQ